MKKVAFIIRTFQENSFHGGGEKLFYHLIKRFSQDGFAVDMYCSESDARQTQFINKIKILVEPYDHNVPETMEKFYKEAKNLVKNKDYDLIISENITPPIGITFLQGHSLANRLKKNKNPLESFLYTFRKVKKQRIKYQKKWMEQGYKRIFVVSEVLKQDIMENFRIPAEQISVVYPGVEHPAYSHPEPLCHPERSEGSFPLNAFQRGDSSAKPQNDTSITIFGLLAPGFNIKGGFIFLKALKILKEKGYEVKAKIIYPKYNKNIGVKTLVKLYNLTDTVEFLPYQKDINAFYDSINCLAVPSLEDTFNIAALEAMSRRKPCIISKNAGAREIIQHKVNGFTFKNTPELLAENMMFFIDNSSLHNSLSEAAFETAKNYSWDRTYKNFLEELERTKIL